MCCTVTDGPRGWNDLFHEVSQFIQSSSRQFLSANEQYIEYDLERLSISSVVISHVDDEVDGDSTQVH